jgi:hypothetical protein
MPAASDDAANALAIMREWDWRQFDPDNNQISQGMDLHSIGSRLAVEGIRRPETIILKLICQGELLAKGRYVWRKYQDCNHYQYESDFEPIKPRHWQRLSDAMQAAKRGDSGSYIETTLQLSELDIKDCLAHDWNPNTNSFSYSVLNGAEPWDDDYLEEWFSARDIEAWPRFLDGPGAEEIPAWNSEAAKHPRGRSAAKWWPDFAEELAVFIHEEGIPDGSGHGGQSEILGKVCARLTAAGKHEPGRATVQPVINAVLARIRSAGK